MEIEMQKSAMIKYFTELVNEHDMGYHESVIATSKQFRVHEDIIWETIIETLNETQNQREGNV